jgi:hypothetical protein
MVAMLLEKYYCARVARKYFKNNLVPVEIPNCINQMFLVGNGRKLNATEEL